MFAATHQLVQKSKTRQFSEKDLPECEVPIDFEVLENGSLWTRRISFAEKHSVVATAGMDKTVRLFNSDMIFDKNPMRILRQHEAAIRGMTLLDPDTLGTASDDGELILWQISTGDVLSRTHIASTSATAMERLDDKRFVVGSVCGELFFYWHDAGQSLQEIHRVTEVHESMISSIAAHTGLMVSVSEDHSAVLRNTNTDGYNRLAKWRHKHSITAAAINEKFIVTASLDTLRIRRRGESIALVKIWTGMHSNSWIYSIKLISRNNIMATGANGRISIMNLSLEKPIAIIRTQLDAVWDATVLPGNRIALCGSWNNNSYIIVPETNITEEPITRSSSFFSMGKLSRDTLR